MFSLFAGNDVSVKEKMPLIATRSTKRFRLRGFVFDVTVPSSLFCVGVLCALLRVVGEREDGCVPSTSTLFDVIL